MINEIKTIVQNYLNNAKLASFMDGVVTGDGVRISDKIILPDELIVGNLKELVVLGDKVRLIRNHGGREFYIAEIVGARPAIQGMTLHIAPIHVGSTTIDSIKINEVIQDD
jgi:hypothetical protein